MVITAHTARVPADVLAGSRELMDLAFDDFEDEDSSSSSSLTGTRGLREGPAAEARARARRP